MDDTTAARRGTAWWDRMLVRSMETALADERTRRRLGRRGTRRRLVLAEAALVAALLTGLTLGATAGIVALCVFVVLFGYVSGQINVAIRMVTELREARLDERQVEQRRRALAVSHRVTLAVLLLLWIGAGAVFGVESAGGEVTLPSQALIPLVGAVVFVHVAFPAAYLAWTLPDEPADEEGGPADP